MSSGWKKKKIGDLVTLEYGKPLSKADRLGDGKYPVYGANGVKCRTNKFYHDRPAIIVGRKGSAGEIHLSEDKFWPLDVTYFAKFDSSKYDLKFLYYLFLSLGLPRLAKGVKPGINRNEIYTIECGIPPLPEQKRIVAILDEAFAAIDKAVANAEKNLANARELFEAYLNRVFVQEGDRCGKKPLGQLTERITKGSSPRWQGISYVEEPGILFITSENVGDYAMDYKRVKYVEARFNEKDAKSILAEGDVLINIVGASIGRTAIFDLNQPANINQAVCLIRCLPDRLNNKYLAFLLNSPYFRRILHDNEIDNARANLSLGFFRALEIPVPDLAEQHQSVEALEALSAQTQKMVSVSRRRIDVLAELKQSILQKAFAGELTSLPLAAVEEEITV